jgi:hypothetical protein
MMLSEWPSGTRENGVVPWRDDDTAITAIMASSRDAVQTLRARPDANGFVGRSTTATASSYPMSDRRPLYMCPSNCITCPSRSRKS